MNPSISVVIPTYNRENYILDAINSVFDQTCTVDEVIIIDDHSSDQTEKIIKSHRYSSKINYLKNKTTQGVSFSRNLGIQKSNSKLIAFLDSDDIWHPQKIAQQISLYDSTKDLFFCHTNENWLMNGKHKNQSKYHKKQGGYFFNRCLERCLVSPSSVLMDKKIFDMFGYFDEELVICEDYDMWLRLQIKFSFIYIDEPLTIKRGGHQNQLSKSQHSIDFFRIKSLVKLIENNELNILEKQQTLEMIRKKNTILKTGAKKRQNTDMLGFTNHIDLFLTNLI